MLLKLLTLISFLYFAQSCGTSKELLHYAPPEGLGLKLEEKNDFKIAGNANLGRNAYYYDVQIGYSPIKNIGIQARHNKFEFGMGREMRNKITSNNFAIGWYRNFIIKNGSIDCILMELYGNTAYGSLDNRHQPQFQFQGAPDQSNLKFNKNFLSGNVSLKDKNGASLNLGIHFGYLNYYKGVYDASNRDTPMTNHFISITQNNSGQFLQYNIGFSFKIRGIYSQLSFSSTKFWNIAPVTPSFNINFGITVDIDNLFPKLKNR